MTIPLWFQKIFSQRSFLALVLVSAVSIVSPSRAALAAITLWQTPTSARSAPAPTKPATEAYYGVYLKGAKIGNVVIRRQDSAPTKAQPGGTVRLDTVLKMDLRVMGANASVTSTSISLTDARSGRPLTQFSQTEGAGRLSKTTVTYTDRGVSYTTRVGANEKRGALQLKPGETFLLDTTAAARFKPQIGQEIKGKVFVAETLSFTDAMVTVTARETVEVSGQTVPAYKVVQTSASGGTTVSYLNEAGDLLRSDGPIGMQIRKEPKEAAFAAPDASGPRPDLISLVAITPTGVPIPAPRAVTTARYSISGATRPLPAPDAIQSAVVSASAGTTAGTVIVTVTTRPLPTSGAKRFVSPSEAPAPLRLYLASTVYVPAESETFQSLARRILGTETDSARSSARIAAWVIQTVKPDPGIVAIRSADDVLKDPRGVCRDFTTLFTAIARAAGIPTKQCVGVVFADGRFLYHAWPEVWVGASGTGVGGDSLSAGWVALEPTFGAPFADATHIKLAEGEITDIARVASDVGSYQINVLEVR
ncbi:MAG: transglutaminase domain-containing protein [Cytophagales bacterium]|nr:transglutaminase domain-containing protein [Armatimonadota bacterium]